MIKHWIRTAGTMRDLLIMAGFLFLLLAGCYKADDFSNRAPSTWEPDIALPLVHSEWNGGDLFIGPLSTGEAVTGPGGIVELLYRSDNYTAMAGEQVQLPGFELLSELNLSSAHSTAFNQAQPGFVSTDSVTLQQEYSVNGPPGTTIRLDTALLKSGVLRLRVLSQVPHTTRLTLVVPSLTLNGQPLRRDLFLFASGQERQLTIDLGEARLTSTPAGQIIIRYIIQVQKTGMQPLPATGQLNAVLSLEEPRYRRISGFFGDLPLPLITNDTLHLGIFKNVISANPLEFQRPSARISLLNSTGMAVRSEIVSFRAYRPGNLLPAFNPGTTTQVLPAQVSFSGPPARHTIEFTIDNGSNVRNVINAFPRYILTGSTHTPEQVLPGTWQYLLDTSRVRVHTEVRLPLDGLAGNLLLRDTFPFTFSSISREIEQLQLRIVTRNGFPADGSLQVLFCREIHNESGQLTAFQRLDSLYHDGEQALLQAGITNSQGEVTEPVQAIRDAVMTGERWKKLREREANCILVRVRLHTRNQPAETIRIFNSNTLGISISARAAFNTSF